MTGLIYFRSHCLLMTEFFFFKLFINHSLIMYRVPYNNIPSLISLFYAKTFVIFQFLQQLQIFFTQISFVIPELTQILLFYKINSCVKKFSSITRSVKATFVNQRIRNIFFCFLLLFLYVFIPHVSMKA